jgi:hypothetical protein
MSNVLKDQAVGIFDTVQQVLDPALDGLVRAIWNFAEEAEVQDLCLVYFTGHGLRGADTQLYLAPTDVDPLRLPLTGLWQDRIMNLLSHSACKRQVLIFDCCWSGRLAPGEKGATMPLSLEEASHGRVILTSSSAYQPSITGDTGSQFTTHLAEAMRTLSGNTSTNLWVDVAAVYEAAARSMQASGVAHQPRLYGQLYGTLPLCRGSKPVPSTFRSDEAQRLFEQAIREASWSIALQIASSIPGEAWSAPLRAQLVRAHCEEGRALIDDHDDARAAEGAEHLRQALTIEPGVADRDVYVDLAHYYLIRRQDEKALDVLKAGTSVLTGREDQCVMLACQARVYVIEKELDKAEASLRKAIEIYPHSSQPHYDLAEVLRLKGDSDGAFEAVARGNYLRINVESL